MFSYLKYLLNKKSLSFPLYLVYHVTYRCNSDCRFCFLAQHLNQHLGSELTLDEVELLSRSLRELLWLTIGGGEPFLREDLPQICALFVRNNSVRKIAIPTNGSLTNRVAEMSEAILTDCPPTVDVTIGLSLDGVGEEHDAIRGSDGSFDKVVHTCERLATLRSRFPNFSLGILTTLSELNIHATQKIGDFVRQHLAVDWHTYELMRGETREPLRPISEQEYAQVLPYILRTTSSYVFGDGIRSKVIRAVKRYHPHLVLQTLREERQVLPCYAGRINGVVDALGNVSLCELMPPVGNLREVNFDFQRVWSSARAESQRATIDAGRCYCTHCIFQDTSILFSPRIYPSLLREMFRS